MQLNELRTFLAIVECGSLVRASEQMNVTQSTVTARLKSLELALGQSLINRQKSGATLTAAGVRLHRYASTIDNLWVQARKEIALPHGNTQIVHLGCHIDLWHGVGERLFNHIDSAVPDAAISVLQGNDVQLRSWSNDGLVDLALTYSNSASQSQEIINLLEDKLMLVSTRKGSPMKFDPKYVFVEAGEEFGQQHAAAYSDAGTARISFNTANAGLQYLLSGGGSAYLPERITLDGLKHGKLFEVEGAPVFSRQAFLVFNRNASENWDWFDDGVSLLQSTLITDN